MMVTRFEPPTATVYAPSPLPNRRPAFRLLVNDRVETGPARVDLALLRAVCWEEPDLFLPADLPSVGVARLHREGLITRRRGQWTLTTAGMDLLDDDF